ncbi:GntR family transcriptional regulator [Saccharopolyspora sp. SCSIO 74807]|uniref:GntR family transcriptional regulator n=1 Tax=Saccharopolyspora sp. SCSIO 74807 TaxID=3118084 RepID=UPI0030D4F37E
MSAAARHKEIADVLRAEIDSQLTAGDRLPSEPELIARFEASRSTIRQALAALRDEGKVQMRHGIGVFVSPPRVVRRLDSRERLSKSRRERNESAFLGDAAAQGFTPSSSVRVWFEPAADFAEIFGIEPADEVCVRDRVMRADGQPVMLATSRLPRRITEGTPLEKVDTGPGGALARLEDLGYGATRYEEIVSAAMAGDLERQSLDMARGPLLHVRRIAWSGDRVVEVNDMKMPGSGYELRYGWDAD